MTVKLRQVTRSEFFGPNYLSWTFAQDHWKYYPYFSNVLQSTLPRSPLNECHTNNAAYASLYAKAVATLDGHRRSEIAHEMQQMEYSGAASGYIIPYFSPDIDAYALPCERRRLEQDGPASGRLQLQEHVAVVSTATHPSGRSALSSGSARLSGERVQMRGGVGRIGHVTS